MKTMLHVLAVLGLAAGFAAGQSSRWPRVIRDGQTQITVYQPQPDSLNGMTVESRVAISVLRPGDKSPAFGALWLATTLELERGGDRAHVVSVKIDRSHIAGLPEEDVPSLVELLENRRALWDDSLSMTRLRATLRSASAVEYRNEPPKIIVTDSPAFLLLLDGPPRLQDAGSGGIEKVVNTAFPVVFDPRTRKFWLYGSSVWFTTEDLLRGPWTSASAPAKIAELVRDTQTLGAGQANSGQRATPEQLRAAKIVVSTEPAELIVTDGPAQYKPLVGGEILYVANSDSDIFMEVSTQRHFVVISGRWFAGPTIDGPWSFIAPENLPHAFAEISEDSPKAGDLAFVPGSGAARDALLEDAIPQTAEVSRGDAGIEVQYDGAPKFASIPNTSIDYAENTPAQVIRTGGRYYACEEGVWYVAPSPNGPWSVSDSRPAGIDGIPPSSPVYNTKFVYVYDTTPEFVRVGYLPGYRWSFPYHGVLVYGTGWRYRGWYGRYYYPRPATWGFCVRYHPWTGWTYGMSWNAGWLGFTSSWGGGWAGPMPFYGPGYQTGFWSGYYAGGWFGPGGYRAPRPVGWHPPGRPAPGLPGHGRPGNNVRPPGRPGNNLYDRPGRPHVRPGAPIRTPSRPSTGPRPRPDRPSRGPGRSGTAPSRPRANPTQPDRPSRGPGRSGTAPSRPPVPSGRPGSAPSTRPDPAGAGRGRPEPAPAAPPAQQPAPDDSGRGRGRGTPQNGRRRPPAAPTRPPGDPQRD